MFINSITQTDF